MTALASEPSRKRNELKGNRSLRAILPVLFFPLERDGLRQSIAREVTMPGIFFEPSDRRSFLKTTILAGAALAVDGCRSSVPRAVASTRPETPLHLALLSDTHVPGDRKT